jgi:putative ABC transport system permease protein
MWLLRDVSLPYFRSHAARTALTLLGIVLGVAAVVATTSVTDAVFGSFRRTIEMTAGRAELVVTNAGAGVPEELVATIAAVPEVAVAAPLVAGFVPLAATDDRLAIFGVDVLGDAEHEMQIPRAAVHLPDEAGFARADDAVALGRVFAAARGLGVGSTLEVVTPRGRRRLVVRGLVDAVGPAALYGGGVGVMSLPAAQRLLAKEGKVDLVDVRLRTGNDVDAVRDALEARIGARARVERSAVHGDRAKELLFSLRVAFGVAGLVAAIVGFLIIYHTITVSLVQRRREIALLGALGIGRAGILRWLGTEALVMGTVAAVLGLGFGLVIARLSVPTFGSVATAWLHVPREDVAVSVSAVLLAALVGLGTTFAATLGPAWSVVSQPVAGFLRLAPGAGLERRRVARAVRWAVPGFVASAVLLVLAPRSLPFGALVVWLFAVVSLVLGGFGFLSPGATLLVGRAVTALAERRRGLRLLLAGSTLARDPARPVAVVAAIVMGLGWIVADASLIASFKGSWLGWLDAHYRSDLLVTSGDVLSVLTYPPIAEETVQEIAAVPGVRATQGIRLLEATYEGRPAVIQALDAAPEGLPLRDGDWSAVAEAFWRGDGVVVSENLAHKTRLAPGAVLALPTPSGQRRLPVLGVFSDFDLSGDLGSIAMSRAMFREVWRDRVVSRIRVWTEPGADIERVRAEIHRRFGASHGLNAATFAEARAAAARLVDDAFALTYSLITIALLISFVGVVNFLLTSVLDRRAELRALHALGVPAGQLAGAVLAEGTLLGLVGATVGLGAGVVASVVLVRHAAPMVNGWHFLYRFPVGTSLGLAVAVLVLAAGAGVLPARLALAPVAEGEGASE